MTAPEEPLLLRSGIEVTDTEVTLPEQVDPMAIYDVLLNGQHVWSLTPDNDAYLVEDRPVVRWPKSLGRHLVGHADVTLREHLSGAEIASTHHVFRGEDSARVEVVDRSGHPLLVDKYGSLIRPLSAEGGDTLDRLLDEVERLMETLREQAGVPAFIAYGTLLGAVRNGELIGHDNDLDIAYVSGHRHPADVAREAFRVERILLEEGWTVRRGSATRINVRIRLGDGMTRYVDVFTAHWVEGILYIPQDTGFRMPEETILPLTTVGLHGRQLPAPRDYEALLAATYGEGWRTPDPSFRYETPEWLARRIGGWFGGLVTHRKHWDTFYSTHRSELPRRPSPFARWVAQQYPSSRPLVDLGTGNARDGRWFARNQGRPVLAVDYAIGAMLRAGRRMRDDLGLDFEVLNLYDARPVAALGVRLNREAEPSDLYARFLLHALEDVGRDNVLRLASMTLRRGGYLFLEFRTTEDRDRPHHYSTPARRFLDPEQVADQIRARGGRIVHQEGGTGRARFRGEDPHVARIVASWSD